MPADTFLAIHDHVASGVGCNPLAGGLGIVREFLLSREGVVGSTLLFLAVAGPRAFRISELYQHFRKKHPLPAWRRAHVTNVDIENVRDAIWLYLLFLAYLVAIGALKIFWWIPPLDFADTVLQLSLLGAVLGKYRTVQHSLRMANKQGGNNVGDVEEWLRQKVDGLGISVPDLCRSVGSVAMINLPLAFAKLAPTVQGSNCI